MYFDVEEKFTINVQVGLSDLSDAFIQEINKNLILGTSVELSIAGGVHVTNKFTSKTSRFKDLAFELWESFEGKPVKETIDCLTSNIEDMRDAISILEKQLKCVENQK